MSRMLTCAMPYPPAGTPFCYAYPFALILRGGREKGKRPKTALAYICYVKGRDGGRVIDYRCRIYRPRSRAGKEWTAPRPLEEADIVRTWRRPPSTAAVAKAKRGLKAVLQP